ncbi:hypothetical protein WH47_01975 [Habropoda laboriosa]|uniref:Uncharacterized protein n=1 Tax=Habropoda laboriosa TaxID=597456 RepID=A0A0L7R0A4_9HYME|nr:hypothetical protein WH47_01975 [Habropoda laboriosa]
MDTPINQHQPAEASECRGTSSSNPTKNHRNSTDPDKSYSHAAQLESTPTEEQAIVVHAVEDVSIREYAITIGKIHLKNFKQPSTLILRQERNSQTVNYITRINHGKKQEYKP